MKRGWLLIGGAVSLACLSVFVWKPQERLIWNRTASAPVGIYWLSDAPFTPGRWVVVSARSDAAQWAQAYGFVGRDWPMIKQVSGVVGDEICRHGTQISINGTLVAEALAQDTLDRSLPIWQGCHTLKDSEVFLLNPHSRSLDGRYFGVTKTSVLDGVATLLLEGSDR